ncbi:hypothetical protein J3Q64DRAFT_1479948 [Phycomyces blakesleeanus]|uniref:Uncharacterized protein n=1 Tax=Phycomyces blakesleeanus TaxID=4837 RepID=A0ABR3B111_PHYBL
MEFRLLSKYDDLFTDVLLDALHLWFPTIKMNADHRHPRVPCARVLEIIQKNLLATERINDAVRELLDIDYFKHYLSTKTIKQQQEFVQHMKRYLCM